MVKTIKRISDQTCFDCKKTPRFDGFISDNQYACPEMSCIICQSCKDKMVGIQKNPLMFIHNIIGPKNSNWYCCHYNPHKLKRCSIQVLTYIFLLHFMIKSYVWNWQIRIYYEKAQIYFAFSYFDTYSDTAILVTWTKCPSKTTVHTDAFPTV